MHHGDPRFAPASAAWPAGDAAFCANGQAMETASWLLRKHQESGNMFAPVPTGLWLSIARQVVSFETNLRDDRVRRCCQNGWLSR
jgi:hypothetical protein